MTLQSLLTPEKPDPEAIAQWLNSLDHAGRVAATRALPRAAQQRLFDVVADFRPLTLSDLVPSHIAAWTAVHHVGINNMPLARCFEKVMYRSADGLVGGYNAQTFQAITGPGYFSAQARAPQVLIDYIHLPAAAPPGFPAIHSNARGLSRFVYRGLQDMLRGVSDHVTVGSASRDGKLLPNHFILVRRDVGA